MTADEARTIPDWLRRNAARLGDRPALVDSETSLSFSELSDAMTVAGKAMLAAGIEHGDRVALWAPNSVRWVEAALGAWSIGATIVPVNTRFKGEEASWVLRRTNAKLLITARTFLGLNFVEMLRFADPELAEMPTVLLDGNPGSGQDWLEFLNGASSVTEDAFRTATLAVDADTVSDILFTSGTTGTPKGAVNTHCRNITAFISYGERLGITEEDRALLVLPLALNFGLKGIFLPFMMFGACCVIAAVHDADGIAKLVEREQITALPGPPALFSDLLDGHDAAAANLSSLRFAVTGSTTISPDFIRWIRASGLFDTIFTAYGMTEIAGSVSLSLPDDTPERIAETSGKVLNGYEVKIVDGDGNQLGAEQQGEIVVRSASVMQCYLDDQKATAAALDADGWFHTGDVGILSTDGYLAITDRIKDMYIVNGFNVYAAEVERMLCNHPAIGQCAVVGVPDERTGAVGFAFVLPTDASEPPSPEAVIVWAKDRMANYKVPRHVELVGEFPLSASMKVMKEGLRARALHRQTGPCVAAPESAVGARHGL